MKKCPQCGREYDNTMSFCLDDGSELLYGPALSEPLAPVLPEEGWPKAGVVGAAGGQFDEPQTAILHETAPPSEAATRTQIHATAAEPRSGLGDGSEKQSISANRAAKPQPHRVAGFDKRLIAAPLVAVILAVGVYVGYRYFGSSTNQIDSIAVMPFLNESGNTDIEYLSDGMTETLIKSLSQLPNLNVKPRSSVFRYKGKDPDLQTIGRELNVQAILNGRVVQRGEQITLSLELVDVREDKVVWIEQYQCAYLLTEDATDQ